GHWIAMKHNATAKGLIAMNHPANIYLPHIACLSPAALDKGHTDQYQMHSTAFAHFHGAFLTTSIVSLLMLLFGGAAVTAGPPYRLGYFSADVTIPLGHRCMGVLPVKSRIIADPLYVHGFVLLGPEEPMVLCAVDWCEIRNGAYDQWRETLAQAAATSVERVLVSCLHQHDAPVVDRTAAQLLAQVGLKGELYNEVFHDQTLEVVAAAVRECLDKTQPITHVGTSQARVEKIASNRRVVGAERRVTYARGSRSGGTPVYRDAPVGQIDPYLKTLSFWNQDQPVLALHAYATHPMSTYGKGRVSSDFVGLARQRRLLDDPMISQIYVSGCSGDVTAGKFNDGSDVHRQQLIDRLYDAMVTAWGTTKRIPIEHIAFRNTELNLRFHPGRHLATESLRKTLDDSEQTVEKRILAAMGLASRQRVEAGQSIDLPCIDFGDAQLVLFPGETFVAYQLLAQKIRPGSFVMSIGYGECWPGYIPTDASFDEHFEDSWLWVAPGSEQRLRTALQQVLMHP
ncbi:MAG: hypothetical protein ACR2OA_19505, partial [Rubripirellula sp.]